MIHKIVTLLHPSLFTPLFLFLLLFLPGCGSAPSISESQLISGSQKILISDLYCPVNGNVVAVGSDGRNGIILFSEDQGYIWRRASMDPVPVDIIINLIRSQTKNGKPGLYSSGYRRAMFPISNEPLFWWMSNDAGQIWTHTEPPLPLGKPIG